MMVSWLVGRLAGRPGRAWVCFNKEHKELKLTCTMIPSRENPLRDYIHNMLRLWNCMERGDKERSG